MEEHKAEIPTLIAGGLSFLAAMGLIGYFLGDTIWDFTSDINSTFIDSEAINYIASGSETVAGSIVVSATLATVIARLTFRGLTGKSL